MTASENPLALSLRQRLLNLARARGEDYQDVLRRYALERWLYRLSQSAYQQQFVLKGALLLALWSNVSGRPTHDLDLLGFGEVSIPHMEAVVQQICALQEGAQDGLEWLPETIQGEMRREEEHYPGLRMKLVGRLGVARIPLTIDVGFGDVVTPAPQLVDFPTLLDQPAPRLRISTKETVIAEKAQIIVVRGLFNSRLKDYFDLVVLARESAFVGTLLCQALSATFARRATPLPTTPPTALTALFSRDPTRMQQWRAFLRKNRLPPEELGGVVELLQGFLWPPLEALAAAAPFACTWEPGGPWQTHKPPAP